MRTASRSRIRDHAERRQRSSLLESARAASPRPLGLMTVALVGVLAVLYAGEVAAQTATPSPPSSPTRPTPIELPSWIDPDQCLPNNHCTAFAWDLDTRPGPELLLVECYASAPDYADCRFTVYHNGAGGWAPMAMSGEEKLVSKARGEVEWSGFETGPGGFVNGHLAFCALADIGSATNKRCFSWSGKAWAMTRQDKPTTTPPRPPSPDVIRTCVWCCADLVFDDIPTACMNFPRIHPGKCTVDDKYPYENAWREAYRTRTTCNMKLLRERCIQRCSEP